MWSSSQLLQKQRADPVIGVILSWKEQGSERPPETAVATGGRALRSLWVQWDRLELMDGLLYRWWEESTGTRKRQLLIPRVLVPEVLQALHDGAGGGHLGQHKTPQKVQCHFYWPQWTGDVQEWCLRCPECVKTKLPTSTARAPLNSSQVGYPMERVALDIFGPLPQTRQGNHYILVITDYFTHWVEAFPMPNQEAPTVT